MAQATPIPTNGKVPVKVIDEGALYAALIRRGKNGGPGDIKLSDEEANALGQWIENDFADSESVLRPFKTNMLEMMKNWRGTKENKNFPFEGASNIRVPLTSSMVETMKGRIIKAIFGGEKITEVFKIDEQLDAEALGEMNQWFEWELREIVHLKEHFEDIIHNTLITGIGLSVPTYKNETRFLHSKRDWEILNLDEDNEPAGITELIEKGKQEILADKSAWGKDVPIIIGDEKRPGVYKLVGPNNLEDARIVFSICMEDGEMPKLVADIWRREVIFNGVKNHCLNLEDLAVVNSAATVDTLPFFGYRLWADEQMYREALDDKFFIDYGEEENKRIFGMADVKVGDYIEREQTREQDSEEGTDSTDSGPNNPKRRWLEIYKWEGWWHGAKTTDDIYGIQSLLAKAQQWVVWYAVRPKKILRVQRIEDLNKDGKRSAIKYDFIKEPGRFFSMGLAEWVHNSQAEMDAIHNQRLDAGLLTNVPFGFYKATAGFKQGIIKIEPGKLFPVADPQGVNFPQTNWRPTFSFQEEQLVKRYAGEQAGLTDPAIGQFTSKRQSASEFVGTASALDLRTEDIVEGFVRSLKEELHRILGLYQQYGPRERIFRAGGAGGVEITKRFEKDRLQGKILLRLTANLQQINEQLQRQLAMDMLSLLLNQLLIQMGIVGPDTIKMAMDKIFKLFHYNGVPLHEPDTGPMSDPPNVENHQMAAGQKPKGPTMSENQDEHLQVHAVFMADTKLQETLTPEARALLQEHVQETIKMQQAKQIMRQQQQIQAVAMAQEMANKGITQNKPANQRPGSNQGPGTKAEGVKDAGASPSAPQPARQ